MILRINNTKYENEIERKKDYLYYCQLCLKWNLTQTL